MTTNILIVYYLTIIISVHMLDFVNTSRMIYFSKHKINMNWFYTSISRAVDKNTM